jgi:hypothetical protein
MNWNYYVYGLGLVADRPIPGLTPAKGQTRLDIKVTLEERSNSGDPGQDPKITLWHVSTHRNACGEPVLRAWLDESADIFILRYAEGVDGVEFRVDRRGTRIWATWYRKATTEDLAVYLLGPVLGFTLRLRGIACLHASGVIVDNRCLAFLGAPGAGKSTLAAAFALSGFPVLSDDVLPLREAAGHFLAGPGSPRLCLWPDAVARLYGSAEALPRLTPEYALYPNWDKRLLELASDNSQFFPNPALLGVIYFLGERCAEADCRMEAISPAEGLMTLVANSYRSELLDKELRAQEFGILARLAAQVPMRRVHPPANPELIPKLCEAILADFRDLAPPARCGSKQGDSLI